MSSIAVQIMLHGLIALVPVNPQGGQAKHATMANHMAALLVNTKTVLGGLASIPECVVEHTPTLQVNTSDKECKDAGCTPPGQTCRCTLSRQKIEIVLDPASQPQPQLSKLNVNPFSSLPFSMDEATDFAYVANMAGPALGQSLNGDFLSETAAPPKVLAARMTFPFESIDACALGMRRDEGGGNVHALSFRQLGTLESAGDSNQALAQKVMAMFTLPDNTQPVKVTLTNFDDTSVVHTMTLKPDSQGYEIMLSNERDGLAIDSTCDDGIARDFAFFYELTGDQNNPPPVWAKRKVPHVKYTRWKSAVELEADECQGGKNPNSRPMCPMASFNPDPQP